LIIFETARQSIGALANISEATETHDLFITKGIIACVTKLLLHECIDVYREASRLISNVLTSYHIQEEIVEKGLEQMIYRGKTADPFSALRYLSLCDDLKRTILDLGAVQPCIRCLSWATEDLKCQVAGLIANLSENTENQITMLQIGVTASVDSLARNDNEDIQQVRYLHYICTNPKFI